MLDVEKFVAGLHDYIGKAIAPLMTRIKALEERPAPAVGKDVDHELVKAMVAAAIAGMPKPRDGKDAEPAEIIRAVKEALEAMPKPADGRSVTVEELAPMVAEQVRAAVAALPVPKDGRSIDSAEVERLVQDAVERMPKPKDGKSLTTEDVAPMLRDLVAAAVASVPAPEPKEVDAELLRSTVQEAVANAIAQMPVPKDGKDADPEMIAQLVKDAVAALPPARDGKDADPAEIAAMVARSVAEMPKPKDGDPGKDADPEVVRTMVADAVGAIPKPLDGKSVTLEDVRPLFDAAFAGWALDFERRAADVLQRAIDKMPAPKDGSDGFGLDDLQIEDDGDGVVTLRFVRGELVKEHKVRLPRFKDCGVFREGVEFLKGDGVTWAGSFFIAQKDAPAGKPGESDDWRLAVKRGRDGKGGGEPAKRQPPGPVRLK